MSKLFNQYSFLIFDWDGTLMDSTGRIVSAMQTTASEAKEPIPSVAQVKSIIGLSMEEVLEKLFPNASESKKEDIYEIYRYQYVEGDSTPSPLFDGTRPLLEWLKSHDIPIAVATGKGRGGLDRVLEESNTKDLFDFTICANESHSKPNPHMIETLLDKASKAKHETLMLGDSIHDLAMAKNASVDAVGVTSGANTSEELELHSPVAILERICHLRDWLETPLPIK